MTVGGQNHTTSYVPPTQKVGDLALACMLIALYTASWSPDNALRHAFRRQAISSSESAITSSETICPEPFVPVPFALLRALPSPPHLPMRAFARQAISSSAITSSDTICPEPFLPLPFALLRAAPFPPHLPMRTHHSWLQRLRPSWIVGSHGTNDEYGSARCEPPRPSGWH